MASLNRTAAALLTSTFFSVAPIHAWADPILTIQPTSIGGGLTRYDVDVDFQDGLGRSGFIQVTFTGPFDAQSQLLEANWPDIQLVDEGTVPTQYVLQGGTGGGSAVDVVPVAQLVVPEGQQFTYAAVVSRNGRNFTIVPEPGPTGLAATCLTMLALLHRRRVQAGG